MYIKKKVVPIFCVLSIAVLVGCMSMSKNDELFTLSEKSLSDGIYHITDNNDVNAYFCVNNNTIQLISDYDGYVFLFNNIETTVDKDDIDDWIEYEQEKWGSPIEYTIIDIDLNNSSETTIALSVSHDEKNRIISCQGIPYIDDETIIYNNVQFKNKY